MSSQHHTIAISKDEYKAMKTLEEAAKRGMVKMVGADPRTGAQFKVNTPWIAGTSRQAARTLPEVVTGREKASMDQWFPRGAPEEVVYKYRAGACENCGAMTHQKKDCLDRPRKVGAKFSGKDFRGDEQMRELEFSYEGKKDRWNGYNPDSYAEVISEYDLMNKKIEDRNQAQGADSNEEFKEMLKNRQYLDPNFDPKTKTSFGLRQKNDKAKYLENLDDNAPNYDGKSRAMYGNPNPNIDPSLQEFKGDDYLRFTGDTLEFLDQEKFAWDHVKNKNSELNSVAMPTLTEMLHKKNKMQSSIMKGKLYEQISNKYGGQQHFPNKMEELLVSKDQYKEFDQFGNEIKHSANQEQGKSKYPEDVYPQDHTSVWGSWWNKELGWGFACCHGTDRNAICLGDKGIKMAIIKEYRIVKKREAEFKFADKNEHQTKDLVTNAKRLEDLEHIIEEQKIHINMEGHKAYEKQLQEISQKREEEVHNQKFQRSMKEQEGGVARERSRSREKHHK